MELILNNITKSFGDKQVLKGATLSFEPGKIYGLLGRNGAGKTTLFNCLSDEVQPDTGTATLVAGSQTNALTPSDVGYVFSTPILPEFLTGREFLKFYLDINPPPEGEQKSIDDWFDLVNIAPEDRDRLIKGYSHGMKNKIQMLACFVSRPPVILLDEPLTSLDVVVALEIKKMLQSLKAGRILIFSTHILQLATDLCDEIVVLNDGQLELVNQDMLHAADFEERLVGILNESTPKNEGAARV